MLITLGYADLRPAHQVHNDPRRHAKYQKHSCGGVSGIVEPGFAYANLGEERLPVAVVGSGIEGSASGLGEDPAFVVPQIPGVVAFLALPVPVLDEPTYGVGWLGRT